MARVIGVDIPLSSLQRGDVVAFRDPDRPSWAGRPVDRLGVVLSPGSVIGMPISPDGSIWPAAKAQRYSAARVLASGAYRYSRYPQPDLPAAGFIEDHEEDRIELVAAFRALYFANTKYFATDGIYPCFRSYGTEEEYEACWRRFAANARPGDVLCTVKPRNIFSVFVSSLDGAGPWSHVAIYVGDGRICEGIPWHGTVVRPLEVYKRKKPLRDSVRIGLYRLCRYDYTERADIDFDTIVSNIPKGYSYIKAVITGMDALVWRFTRYNVTPMLPVTNIFILQGSFYLVDHV